MKLNSQLTAVVPVKIELYIVCSYRTVGFIALVAQLPQVVLTGKKSNEPRPKLFGWFFLHLTYKCRTADLNRLSLCAPWVKMQVAMSLAIAFW